MSTPASPGKRPTAQAESADDIRTCSIVRNLIRYYSTKPESSRNMFPKPTPMSPAGSGLGSADYFSQCASPCLPPTPLALPSEGVEPLASDPTLTAFAQLGAFRLQCPRAFISLIDYEYQFIVAEATQSTSLHDVKKCMPGDELFVGPVKLPVQWGICPDTVHAFKKKDDSADISDGNTTANRRCYIINDLAKSECFQDRPYVTGPPFARFYAEVPLKTRSGCVIGSFCVVDTTPRNGLDEDALDRLIEVGDAIMEHLELVISQERLNRADQMMQGLGRFVDGKSVQEWWKEAVSFRPEDLAHLKAANHTGQVQTLTSDSAPTESADPPNLFSDPVITSLSNIEEASSVEDMNSANATLNQTTRSQTGPDRSPVSRINSMLFQDSPSTSGRGSSRKLSRSLPSNVDEVQQEQAAFSALKLLFSRASHLIRETSDLDGIIFADASLQDLAVVRQNRMPTSKLSSSSAVIDQTVRVTQDIRALGDSEAISMHNSFNHAEFNALQGAIRYEAASKQASTCELLGFSLPGDFGQGRGIPGSQHLEIQQSTMRNLLQCYPHGKVFHFTEDGELMDADDEEFGTRRDGISTSKSRAPSPKSGFEKEKERLRAYQLLDICTGARSIAFFPLWDPHRDHWFAISLAWTKDFRRLLQSEDVTFLAAFGSCIMAEKSKLEALTVDRAKVDFISSVSHELRSPLHGVLATVEALQETTTDLEQVEMIRTITGCGEVLLDTMDHILDYAKVHKSGPQRKLGNGDESPYQSTAGKLSTFDLADLVERVVEGVFAGHNYRTAMMADNSTPTGRQYTLSRSTHPGVNPNIVVVLEIERRRWICNSQIGAWKRILTNLFGNSLKYTESGFIRVAINSPPLDPKSPTSGTCVVRLDVEDSGIGMSRDFLKHRAYTPFAQANPLSDGTGLGLSIVCQLVKDLKGSVDIDSELAYGTGVRVSIPVKVPPPTQLPEELSGSAAILRDIAVWCKGLTICLVGFDYYPEISETPDGILGVQARRMLAMRSSFTTLAEQWFELKVTTATSLGTASGDILLGLESQIKMLEMVGKTQPLIVFEDSQHKHRPADDNGVFYLAQPAGPHKFARVLGFCIEYRSGLPGSSSSDDGDQIKSGPRINVALNAVESSSNGRIKKSQLSESDTGVALRIRPEARLARLRPPTSAKYRSTVLLVEDNMVNMKILVNHMKRAKEDYATAINGLEALKRYREDPMSVKVIFMDIAMPVMDGVTATRAIRQFEAEHWLPRVRIVALTCFSSDDYERNAFTAGVDIFLVKPAPMKSLKPILAMDPKVVVVPEHNTKIQ